MIRLDRVTKRYGRLLALHDVSLAVAPGTVVALVGPNGAGKSTALRIAAGLARPSAGTAAIGGHDTAADPVAARRLLGYVPQRLAVPEHATCGELGRLVAALRGLPRDAVRTALADVGLADRWEARVRDLSGGQRQRLSLALADAGRPRALVLDEPSISLDADGAETVCRAVRAAQTRGAAVLFASHHLHEVAALADRVVLLGRGSVVAERAGALLRDPGAFAAFYRLAACEVADAA